VAIDAIQYAMKNREYNLEQFKEQHMLRDINKALAGFQPVEEELVPKDYAIATGNWGCGVFGGMVELKSLEQWLAASQYGRAVQYYAFGDECAKDLELLGKELVSKKKTVGNLWDLLTKYNNCLQNNDGQSAGRIGSLFQFIKNEIQNENNVMPVQFSNNPYESSNTSLPFNPQSRHDINEKPHSVNNQSDHVIDMPQVKVHKSFWDNCKGHNQFSCCICL